jgi:cell division transport system permease protein
MVKPGRASIKRGKPSYFMSILGVTLVLCLLGIIGIITINSRKLITNLKESVEVHVFLKQNIKDTARERLQHYIASQPYVKEVEYTDKETAKKEWLKTGGEDFTEFIDNSLLPASIDFKLKAEFLDSAKLAAVKAELSQFPIVDEVRYPIAVVNKMVSNFRTISIALLIVAILISVMVIILIDNTIRLAMFSNRFLIKTMQMVGATRWFIARPLDVRAIINGSISGVIATAIVYLLMLLAENFFDGFKKLHDTQSLTLLGFVLVLLGIGITLFSTHRSVIKYLRMKLDELY